MHKYVDATWYSYQNVIYISSVLVNADVNIAQDAMCAQSRADSFLTCERTGDGDLKTHWTVPTSQIGQWIQFDFNQPRDVQRIYVWSYKKTNGQCSGLKLSFSNSITKQVGCNVNQIAP